MSTLVIILNIGFIALFAHFFSKDKDHRKLLFIAVFLFGILSQLNFMSQELIGYQFLPNLDVWVGLTQVSGILTVIICSIYNEKDFKKGFNSFLIATAISALIVLVPFQINSVMVPVYVVLSMIMLVLSLILVVRERTVSNLIFLITTFFYILAQYGLYARILNPETIFVSISSGNIFLLLIFLTAKNDKEKGVAAFFAYKRELKETRKELKKSKELLKKSEKIIAIGQAATMVGHDLRNPLQTIQNSNCYIEKQLNTFNVENPVFQKMLRFIQISNDSIEYANKIVLDLKDYSSERTPELIMVDINDLLNESLRLCNLPNNIKIIKEFSQAPRLKLDSVMMKRVFMNMISNGVQAMPEGGIFIVSTKKLDGFVEVSFEDSGKGISKENMKNLFKPFFTTKAKGMGIGLAICKKFVEQNGGSIDVESKESEGAKFMINLPFEKRIVNNLHSM